MLLQNKLVNAADFPTLQMAVDALEEFGTLYVPAGKWACSGIKLKSNMTLHLALGAKLMAPARIEEYVPHPDWHRESSLTCAFLALYEVENVVIEESNAPVAIYNLHGQKLDKLPASGIVIINGRKYIIK